MKKLVFLYFLVHTALGFAQKPAPKKTIQKPLLLKAQGKTQIIGMEYPEDILYFSKTDLLPLVENMARVDKHPAYRQMIDFLNASSDEFTFKQKDSTQFKNLGERNLYKTLLQLAPEMRKERSVAILDKRTKQFNVPKTKAQTISMEYRTETLYFSKADLTALLNKKSQSDKVTIYNPVISYLNEAVKPVLFAYNDTSKLITAAEKNLRKILLDVAPQILAEGKAADKVKKTGAFNKQVFVNPCENSKEKKLITEKKGRIILGCE